MSKGIDNHNEMKDINLAHSLDGYCCLSLRFKNGYLLSLNLGRTGYNENRNVPSLYFGDGVIQTNTAECCVFDPEGKVVTRRFFPDADKSGVAGWVKSDDVFSALCKIRGVS